MSDLRRKLAKPAAAPVVRTAQTFTGAGGGIIPATGAEATRNNTRTTVYLSPQLRRQLKIVAAERDMTMNDIVVAAIEQWLSNCMSPDPPT
jgi:hypothetical protein